MHRRFALIGVLSFSAGFVVHMLIGYFLPMQLTSDRHWRIVNAYRAHIMNPENYSSELINGYSVTRPPPDPTPSLFALVNEGELEHLDIVFPNVPLDKESNLVWMKFVESHEDVIHGIGNSTYTDYQVKGKQPLHLNLWFRPRAREAVQDLIKQLEAL